MMRRVVQACVLAVLAAVMVSPAVSADSDHHGDHGTPGTVDQGAPEYYDSGLSPTPYMGWNTYYGLGASTEDQVKSVADVLVSSGLRTAGYDIVWLDGGWQGTPPRDSRGRLTADQTRFPHGIPAIVDYLHRKGLKAGIYTDAGAFDGRNCGLGSGGGYYERDARQFADWKFDAIKVDFLCGLAQKLDPGRAFGEFSAAVARSGRKMILNLCNPVTSEWGVPITPEQNAVNNYVWGPTTGDSWRTYTDLAFGTPYPGGWANILRAMDSNAWHPEANGPGHFNDADYLLPMRPLPDGTGYELDEEESTSQFVMWAQMATPLIIGSDPRKLPQSMIDTLSNPEIIAVDQDKLGIQGVRVQTSSAGDVYSKVLSGRGRRSVVLLNRGDTPSAISVDFTKAGLSGDVRIRDLRKRTDLGTFTGSYSATVAPHGTAMLKLSGTDFAPGADLGGDASASPALVRFSDTDAVAFTRAADGTVLQNTRKGATWSQQWKRLDGGGILGQPAAYGSAGGRIDLFARGPDNAAYQRIFRNGQWGPWTWLGGSLTDAPTVAFGSPGDWTLFARGRDGQVWQRGSTGGWSSIGAPNGKPIYGRPSAVLDASGPHVAVRTADDAVWIYEKGAWASLGGVISGSPTLLATSGRIYLFARASDYTLWQRNFAGGGWGGWFPRGEFPSNAFDGSPGVAAGDDGSAWVAFRGVGGSVHQVVL
jgi:alpha-galactosidase